MVARSRPTEPTDVSQRELAKNRVGKPARPKQQPGRVDARVIGGDQCDRALDVAGLNPEPRLLLAFGMIYGAAFAAVVGERLPHRVLYDRRLKLAGPLRRKRQRQPMARGVFRSCPSARDRVVSPA